MEGSVRRTLEQAGLSVDDVDLVVPHQANLRIIEATCNRLGVPMEKVVLNIADHGNTSAASVPMALNDAVTDGRVQPGATVLFTAFGGGLTWGSNVMVWGDRVEPVATSDADLPPTDKTVFDLRDESGVSSPRSTRRRRLLNPPPGRWSSRPGGHCPPTG